MDDNREIDLLQQELKLILNQLQKEALEDTDDGLTEVMGVDLKKLDEMYETHQPRMEVQFVKCHPDAKLPSYNYSTDSGFDLYSVEEFYVGPLQRAIIPTGLKFDIKEGYEIQVRSKSGLAINQGLFVLNSPGTVDSGYNGEIKVILFNTNQTTIHIPKFQKIAQACICPVANGRWIKFNEVDELREKDRGENGFGSTGI